MLPPILCLYTKSDWEFHECVRRFPALETVLSIHAPCLLKARRRDYGDIMFPESKLQLLTSAKWYAYVVVPTEKLYVIHANTLITALLVLGNDVPSKVIDDELCYFVSLEQLKEWEVPYGVGSVPGLLEWVAAQ
ncbi:MAG TPA: hypothetical protein VIK98_07675 [Limnochordales bacterium]